MKKFRFRLKRVLQLREQLEKQKQQELAVELQQEHRLRQRRSWLAGQIERYYQKLRDQKSGIFRPATLQGLYNHLASLEQQQSDNSRQLTGQQKQTAQKREELIAASRQRRLLELVQERRIQEYQEELKREEAVLADEMAGTRFLWRQREGQ
jgi:flagellar protein FliJ